MNDQPSDKKDNHGINWYVAKRLGVVAVLIILVVWAFSSAPAPRSPGEDKKHGEEEITAEHPETAPPQTAEMTETAADTKDAKTHAPPKQASRQQTTIAGPHGTTVTQHEDEASKSAVPVSQPAHIAATESHGAASADAEETPPKDSPHDKKAEEPKEPVRHEASSPSREKARPKEHEDQPAVHDTATETRHEDLPTGVAFVDAAIKPLGHELNGRFWGWRPNDIVNFTDNVNNYQLGVLEVTRRTVVLLAERISRTGTTDAFNRNLENAMNWLMVKADRYWFPSPESKYKESIEELEAYKKELLEGRGSFYTRTDNLIPLLSSYEDLLGSCDENLVKQNNEEGSRVSLFKADDYFFYAKGVASALATILEAIHHDFSKTLENRHATELLHHALESCRQAAELDPLLITNGELDGILANHRANMAAPISHARFYIGQLIKTLST